VLLKVHNKCWVLVPIQLVPSATMQSTTTSTSQTVSLNELRSTWLNSETPEEASTVLGKLMDETHINR
jgi:hypothetical protein